MKRLLLLFILSPVILFGQTRRKAIVDSIKAETTDLRAVSTLINNVPGSKIEQINASDSGEYVNVLVRIRVIEPVDIVSVQFLSAIKMETGNIISDMVSVVTVPLPARLIVEADTILAIPPLPPLEFNTEHIVSDMVNVVTIPSLSRPIVEADTILAMSLLPALKFDTEDILFIKAYIMEVPPSSRIDLEPAEALFLLTATQFRIEDIVAIAVHTVAVPALAELELIKIDAIPVLAITLVKTGDIIITGNAGMVDVPALSEIELGIDDLPLFSAVQFPVSFHYLNKIDTTAIPVFEERRMPVTGMHLSDEGYSLLEKLEGFSPMPYALKDGGLTIGFGFFVPYGEGSMWRKGMTWEEAEQMIRKKMPTYEDQVKQYINVPLTQNEFDALTMLAYNLGGFSKATSIVNDVNRQVDFDKVESDWKRFVHSKAPGVAKGLMNRRKDELQVRNESDYQPERKIQILKNIK